MQLRPVAEGMHVRYWHGLMMFSLVGMSEKNDARLSYGMKQVDC